MKLVNILGRTRTIEAVNNTSKSVTFPERHGHGATACVRNDTDRTVFVSVASAAFSVVYPTGGNEQRGTHILPGTAECFDISSEDTVFSAIHKASGGTGDVHITISREGGN